MNELDHLNVELSGTSLVEASAGTGKTYAIALLYLRLLLEKNLTPEQLLVVTFTEAATEELRGRIRNRIREALEVFEGAATKDPLLKDLCGNVNGRTPDSKVAIDILTRALNSFDTASIFTIHGFCLRALQDNAFESGSLYDTDLVTDQKELLQEIVDDFWRVHFFDETAPLVGYAVRRKYTPEYFLKFLRDVSADPSLDVRPRYPDSEIIAIEARCRSAFDRVGETWTAKRAEIEDILHNNKGLSRSAGKYRSDCIPPLVDGMETFVEGNNPYDLFTGFEKLCASWIEEQRLAKNPPPQHEFFDLCEELQKNVEERFLALHWQFLLFCRERLPDCKRELNIRFFDDLLRDLYTALMGENGDAFAASLRNKYRAALIDEFQDTDPVQYDIFRKIYSDPDSPLFLIGDPKQAIYSFRGADIFAYIAAAADVDEVKRFTLTGNHRSTKQLLDAFNTIFNNERKPFVFDDIAYHPITSGKTEGWKQLTSERGDNAPLQLWYIPPDEEGNEPNVGTANDVVPVAVAAEVSRLLQGGQEKEALIDGRPVSPGDIAVLVRDHWQAGYIQDSLRALGIPSVMRSDKSIFATDEAREVCTLVGAIADPGCEYKVRAALVTDLLGSSGDDVAKLLDSEKDWEERLSSFREYHQTWLDRGFMVMARALMAREGVRGRLLRRPDGERRMTNLLHCFEVGHHAAREKGLGIEGLLTWFGERVTGEESADEYQIRLETDDRAVRIVTVHVSKGLQYPIVFCPFMWGGLKGDGKVAAFHEGHTMAKDFGSPDHERNRALARKEALAESLRLLYVAMTRAEIRCYLVAGKIVGKTDKNRPETSPLSYLFHASAGTRITEDLVAGLAADVGTLQSTEMLQQLNGLVEEGKESISLAPVPAAEHAVPYVPVKDDGEILACREFSGKIFRDWHVASFTSFVKHDSGAAAELPDRDESWSRDTGAGMAAAEVSQGKSIFTFPKGAQAGIFMHGIFEELDFSHALPDKVNSLVEKGLERYGYEPEWLPHVSSMVTNVVTTPIASPEGHFTLAGLKRGQWLAELEFFFPLNFVTSDTLRDNLRKWGHDYEAVDIRQVCHDLRFRPVRGMVRGFMDMVFEQGGRYYLIDWKSNHLGYQVEAYGKEGLRNEMARKLYPLQYLLYTVALNKFLSLRVTGYDYKKNFGGVLYMFLRGISPERGEEFGVFRDTPPAGMIQELTEYLIQAGE